MLAKFRVSLVSVLKDLDRLLDISTGIATAMQSDSLALLSSSSSNRTRTWSE